jgi:peptidoglycan/LPS O-acetylase OafA/YrhL
MMKTKRLTTILLTVLAILLIPFIAMQVSNDVSWSAFDFMVAAILLLGTGLLIDLVLRKVKSKERRIILLGVILLGLFLIWAELAVGVFGTPLAGS